MARETKRNERKMTIPSRRKGKPCFFCENKQDIVDYKDIDLLKRFISMRGKILPRRQSCCCALHQRGVSEAIRRARFVSLLPYVTE